MDRVAVAGIFDWSPRGGLPTRSETVGDIDGQIVIVDDRFGEGDPTASPVLRRA